MPIQYSKQAEKFLNKQNNHTFFRIISAIDKLPEGDVVKMKNIDNTFRLRVGSFRILFKVHDNVIFVTKGTTSNMYNHVIFVDKIESRGQVYKK